ncbi:MAG: membrane protein of unknown function [Nitrospira sp.]|nr:MAG: membrane protein of unknown function [Nitrospira sp.]
MYSVKPRGPRPIAIVRYVVRYWRGELSLAHSFWLTNVLVDAFFGLVQQFFASRQEATASPLLVFRLYTSALFLHMFVIHPWQTVGLWRAARQYLSSCSGWFWGRATQGLIVLCLLAMLITVPYWAPMYFEQGKIAVATEDYRYRVSFSEDGHMLHIEGGIGVGLVQTVAHHLKHTPGVEVIGLNSHGGLLAEATKVQALVEQIGLSTYVTGRCQSACIRIFLAGGQRFLHKDASLGFHRGYFPGMPEVAAHRENERSRAYMLSQGVEVSFVDKAMGVPAYDLWIPTSDELLQAGVVMDIVDHAYLVTGQKRSTVGAPASGRDRYSSGSHMRATFQRSESGLLSAPAANRPSSFNLFKKGNAHYVQSQYARAIPWYRSALEMEKISRRLPVVYWRVLVDNLGMAYGLTGRLAEAKAMFEYGLRSDPQYPMFHYNLACTYAEMNAPDEAMRSLAVAFRYRQYGNPGEGLPDPRTDSSFQRYLSRPDFRLLLDRLATTPD